MKRLHSIAIIPARGGSKRIPHKNIKSFCGLPIIAYSIRTALQSGVFDEVMVSTDDDEIAAIAREYGATVPFFRSEDASNDHATTADVLREVLSMYRDDLDTEFDTLCCLYPTAPFVTALRLRTAAHLLDNPDTAGAFSCVKYSYPVQRGLQITDAGYIEMCHPEYATARSQDLRDTYHDAGQFYFKKVTDFLSSNSLWGERTIPVVLSELEVQDLDTMTDWSLAEMKFSMLQWPDHIETEGYRLQNYTTLDAKAIEEVLFYRNLPSIRNNMVNREPITMEQHIRFICSLYGDRSRGYYAVRDTEGNLIGSVDIHITGEGKAERGIWIAPVYQGRKHAAYLLRQLYAWLSETRDIHTIETEVYPYNAASLALERSLGAKHIGTENGLEKFTILI